MKALAIGLMVLAVVACTGTVGTLPRITLLAPTDGFKMLRPNVSATRCRAGGLFARDDGDLAGAAVKDLLTRDDEGDAVLNVKVESTSWSLGVYGRRCVTVSGDVVRSVRSVVLPMPGSHAEHHDR